MAHEDSAIELSGLNLVTDPDTPVKQSPRPSVNVSIMTTLHSIDCLTWTSAIQRPRPLNNHG